MMGIRVEEEIATLLRAHGLTIAISESASGGLISHLITNVPGSSNYFRGAVVAYDNEMKVELLGVSRETLARYGAVSRQAGEEMAQGVRRLMGADIGLSNTGVAGPTGATSGKPVGLFHIGISSAFDTSVVEHVFGGDRLQNKRSVAEMSLTMLKEHLLRLV
ncbi:CinA family protein [Chloroflexota bacterium]